MGKPNGVGKGRRSGWLIARLAAIAMLVVPVAVSVEPSQAKADGGSPAPTVDCRPAITST